MNKPGCCEVILTGAALSSSKREVRKALVAAALRNGLGYEQARSQVAADMIDFRGPVFMDCVAQVNMEDGFVAVQLLDGSTYTYPMHSIGRVKTWVRPEPEQAQG